MLLLRQLNVNNQDDNYANSLATYQFINVNEKENHETSSQIDKGREENNKINIFPNATGNWYFSRIINARHSDSNRLKSVKVAFIKCQR